MYFIGGGGKQSWTASWRRKTGKIHVVGRETEEKGTSCIQNEPDEFGEQGDNDVLELFQS